MPKFFVFCTGGCVVGPLRCCGGRVFVVNYLKVFPVLIFTRRALSSTGNLRKSCSKDHMREDTSKSGLSVRFSVKLIRGLGDRRVVCVSPHFISISKGGDIRLRPMYVSNQEECGIIGHHGALRGIGDSRLNCNRIRSIGRLGRAPLAFGDDFPFRD